MSDSMSSVEIEDVLSSIRRLVSEDLRPVPRPSLQAGAANKLILTPALRVVSCGEEGAEGLPPVPERVAVAATGVRVMATVADSREAEPDDAEFPEPPTSDLQAVLDGIAQGPDETVLAALSEPEEPAEATPATAGAAPSIEAVVAAVGAAVVGQSWDGEGEDHAVGDGDWSHDGWPGPASADLVLSAMEEVEEAEVIVVRNQEDVFAAIGWAADDGGSETAADTDLQMGVFVSTRDTGSVAPSDAGAAVPPPDDLTTRDDTEKARDDRAEAEAVAEIMGAGLPEAKAMAADEKPGSAETAGQAAPSMGVFDAEDAVLDEEVLRDLVRDIIREELQGAIGERITRNVRKLVRAEINRVLASRELD